MREARSAVQDVRRTGIRGSASGKKSACVCVCACLHEYVALRANLAWQAKSARVKEKGGKTERKSEGKKRRKEASDQASERVQEQGCRGRENERCNQFSLSLLLSSLHLHSLHLSPSIFPRKPSLHLVSAPFIPSLSSVFAGVCLLCCCVSFPSLSFSLTFPSPLFPRLISTSGASRLMTGAGVICLHSSTLFLLFRSILRKRGKER